MRFTYLLCIYLLFVKSNCFTVIFGMGQIGRKEGNPLRFQTKVTKYFCRKFVRWYDFYMIYCSKLQDRGLIKKNTGKHNTKSKLSKGPKNPTPHIDDILRILCPFLGAVTPKPSLRPETVLSCKHQPDL